MQVMSEVDDTVLNYVLNIIIVSSCSKHVVDDALWSNFV